MVRRSLRVGKVLGSVPGPGCKYDKFLRYEKYSVKLSLKGTKLEIFQNSVDLCGAYSTVGRALVSWMTWQHAAVQH